MVAMTPLIAIQVLGVVYKLKTRKAPADTGAPDALASQEEEIIDV